MKKCGRLMEEQQPHYQKNGGKSEPEKANAEKTNVQKIIKIEVLW